MASIIQVLPIAFGIWVWALGTLTAILLDVRSSRKDWLNWLLSLFIWWVILPFQLWGLRRYDIYNEG